MIGTDAKSITCLKNSTRRRMISFRLTKHTIREVDIVEVYDGDRFVASIYPAETSMRIVSDHLASVNVDETVVPAFTFEFKDAPTQ